jgi:hypothetical protein
MALPTLYAATEPDLEGGMFIGPDGPGERGHPRVVGSNSACATRRSPAPLEDSEQRLGAHAPGAGIGPPR